MMGPHGPIVVHHVFMQMDSSFQEDIMATSNDPIRQVFLAGIGALAIGAEKSQQLVNQLVEKGKMTVDEGKSISADLTSQAEENFDKVRRDIIEAHMKTMTKEQRDDFAAQVAEMAANIDIDDALEKQEAEEVKDAASE